MAEMNMRLTSVDILLVEVAPGYACYVKIEDDHVYISVKSVFFGLDLSSMPLKENEYIEKIHGHKEIKTRRFISNEELFISYAGCDAGYSPGVWFVDADDLLRCFKDIFGQTNNAIRVREQLENIVEAVKNKW